MTMLVQKYFWACVGVFISIYIDKTIDKTICVFNCVD